MRRVRLAVVLPVVQVFIAAILLVWTDLAIPIVYRYWWRFPRREVYIDECVIATNTVSHGINAPALLFRGLALSLRWQGHPVWGVGVEDVFYLAGVVVLWYLAGRTLDRRRFRIKTSASRTATGRVWFNLLLVFWGTLLFVGCFTSFYELTRASGVNIYTFYFNWNVWAIVLALVWALTLLIFPGLNLAHWIRSKRADAGVSPRLSAENSSKNDAT
jgi:hypothetical protein